MQSHAPGPCFFILSRAPSGRYFQPIPVDPLLPIQSHDAEICSTHDLSQLRRGIAAALLWLKILPGRPPWRKSPSPSSSCGEEFVYRNKNGKRGIRKAVLAEFSRITRGQLVWVLSERAWRR